MLDGTQHQEILLANAIVVSVLCYLGVLEGLQRLERH
jgi:hypothetical protein